NYCLCAFLLPINNKATISNALPPNNQNIGVIESPVLGSSLLGFAASAALPLPSVVLPLVPGIALSSLLKSGLLPASVAVPFPLPESELPGLFEPVPGLPDSPTGNSSSFSFTIV